MFVTIKLNTSLPIGTIVCHDSENVWRQANSSDVAPLGILRQDSFVDEDNQNWAQVTVAGEAFARASANLPASGGWLACDDSGRVTTQLTEANGLVAPLSRGAASSGTDDLVLVWLR
jgi:hypothetical protein